MSRNIKILPLKSPIEYNPNHPQVLILSQSPPSEANLTVHRGVEPSGRIPKKVVVVRQAKSHSPQNSLFLILYSARLIFIRG